LQINTTKSFIFEVLKKLIPMSKKLEDKILEELKKRVFEEEEKLKQKKENAENKKAFLQALDEVTSLNAQQIKEIEQKVREEFLLREQQKSQSRRQLLQWSIGGTVVLVLIFYFIFRPKPEPQVILLETFDDNRNGWLLEQPYLYRRTHENNTYVFECNRNDWCYWDNARVNFPQEYTVEVGSIWKEGRNSDHYGFLLLQDNSKYGHFSLKAVGEACYQEHKNGEWADFKFKPVATARVREENVQKVIVKGKSFQYFVNDTFVEEGKISESIAPKEIALRVCGKQKIAFTFVKVTDNQTGNVLMLERFVKPHPDWEFKESFDKQYKIENGQYLMNIQDAESCYFSDIPLPTTMETQSGVSYILEVDCTWKEGDMKSFGITLNDNAKNTINFNLLPDGKGSVATYEKGKVKSISNWRGGTTQKTDGNTVIHQKVILKNKNKEYEYYINEQLIERGQIEITVNNVGVRSCGKQIVAFDNLKITKVFE
jgi:hypothetical protein